MSKTIRLECPVYDRLDQFRGKHETYSHAVDRLLNIRDGIASLTQTIEGGRAFTEYHEKQIHERSGILPDAIGTDLEGKPLVRRLNA